ncbi:MAG: SDR family NAD(P)-dependent oxidoreductase [Gammaproteobacteria bacterium]|jgi:NAD(P)-dependent dehydrogenase (short-subunit alcohol dehydrogenase family)|nr:SDR family NAD(P)-dependent oxidoreductase [Gammaproteobacteria bacterium]
MGEQGQRVVIVTGAAGNLGAAVAAAFAARGDRLALLDRDVGRLDETRRSLGLDAGTALLAVDLLSAVSTADAAAEVVARLGRVDVLANIAGGFTMGPPLHETPDADWDLMMGLNARSVLNMCRAVVPHFRRQGGGRVVNVAARAALEGKARMGPYCASKAAVITLTETLAAEHRDHGITANCILPGTIDTPQNRASMPDADFSRWVPPAALADVIVFLASDAARAITGAAIPVYGRS